MDIDQHLSGVETLVPSTSFLQIDLRQDDVCTELRHRAEQADLEAPSWGCRLS